MKLLQYLNYFFYIAFNWNIRLALFTIRHEIRGEKKYGIDTIKLSDLKGLSIKADSLANSEQYQGSNYYLLEKLFSFLADLQANQAIVDFGCGKGRVLAVAAYYGFNKITGIEFARELCDIARKNILPLQDKYPASVFTILHLNVLDYEIRDEENIFFFFNPFNHVIMLAVVKKILQSLKTNPRKVYVIYINPTHKEMFMSAGFEEIYHVQKFYYVNGSILVKDGNEF